jgi:hypothetical protein
MIVVIGSDVAEAFMILCKVIILEGLRKNMKNVQSRYLVSQTGNIPNTSKGLMLGPVHSLLHTIKLYFLSCTSVVLV